VTPITEPFAQRQRDAGGKAHLMRRQTLTSSLVLCASVSLWWMFLQSPLHLPQNLPHQGKEHVRVVGPEFKTSDQLPQFLFA